MFFVTIRTIVFGQHSLFTAVIKWKVFTEMLSLFTAVASGLTFISPSLFNQIFAGAK